MQSRLIKKGAMYEANDEEALQKYIGQKFNGDVVPQWVLLVYKEYVYDYKVRQQVTSQEAEILPLCSVCGQGRMSGKRVECEVCKSRMHGKCKKMQCDCDSTKTEKSDRWPKAQALEELKKRVEECQ